MEIEERRLFVDGKSLESIDFDSMVYYDETSPSFIRHKTDKRYGNGKTLVKRFKGDMAGNLSKNGYYFYSISGLGTFPVHRIIWKLLHKEDIPIGYVIDHIDGNKLNNKITNLRLVTKSENARNASFYKNNTTGVVGVYLDKKNKDSFYWKACWMELDGKQKTKSFSINKFGYEYAKEMAIRYRKEQIDRLNEQGAGYSERHGT